MIRLILKTTHILLDVLLAIALIKVPETKQQIFVNLKVPKKKNEVTTFNNQVQTFMQIFFFLHRLPFFNFLNSHLLTLEDKGHLSSFWHPPVCPHGIQCKQIKNDKDGKHAADFKHLCTPCGYGLGCRLFRNLEHQSTYSHEFLPPCKKLFTCKNEKLHHREAYSHLCREGGSCTQLKDRSHTKHFYHFLNHPCPDKSCARIDEEHLMTYSHPKIADIRPICTDVDCSNKNIKHLTQYSHPVMRLEGFCPVNPLTEELGLGENKDPEKVAAAQLETRIPFQHNVATLKRELLEYGRNNKMMIRLNNNPKLTEITNWFTHCRPIHRMSGKTLSSVLKTGALMSLHQLKHLSADSIYPLVISHPLVMPIVEQHQSMFKDFIKSRINLTIEEAKGSPQADRERVEFETRKKVVQVNYQIAIETLEHVAKSITEAALTIKNNLIGIFYHVDEKVGTDKTVFSIVGPHTGEHYGKVVIVLKEIIKWHPNFYFLMHAATYYYGHKGAPATHTTRVRPWGKGLVWEGEGKEHYFRSKMHPIASPEVFELCALDFIARVALKESKSWDQVSLEDIRKHWYETSMDSHEMLEGHLPYQVPLNYIEAVVVDKEEWDTLSAEDKEYTKKLFGTRLNITDSTKESFKLSMKICESTQTGNYNGFCFSLEPPKYQGYESFIPLKLAYPNKIGHFYFESIGDEFVVCLCETEQISQQRGMVISIIFNHNSVAISPNPPIAALAVKPPASDSEFNTGLNRTQKIHYAIQINLTASTITVSHTGSSEVYCVSPPLVYESDVPLDKLFYVSFSVIGKKSVEFYNARMPSAPVPSALLPIAQNQSIHPGKGQPGNNPGELPKCPKDLSCPFRGQRSPDAVDHNSRYRHRCLWGAQCTDKSASHDVLAYHHMLTKKCKHGTQCKKREEKEHREKKIHVGLWDFLLPCNRKDHQQCDRTKYFHG